MWSYVLVSLLYLLLLAALVKVAYTPSLFHHYTLAKGLCSGAFFLIAAVGIALRGSADWGHGFLLVALACCWAGDVLLGLANRKGSVYRKEFRVGTVFFLLAHLFFCLSYAVRGSFVWWQPLFPLFCLAVMYRCCVSEHFKLKSLKIPALIYSFVVGLMVTQALQFFLSRGGAIGVLSLVGSVLFFISDVVLLYMYFYYRKKVCLRFFNLFTYYIGVLLLAFAAGL